jgi:G3E family GTPase
MTKVDIISGFLGAGKTTLISKLLKEALNGEQVVLIENEFGEIGIDGGFLKDSGVEIREMNSGCICCSLVGDFGTSLKEVVDKYHPDRIIIEPSGVGKLSDVIKAVKDLHIENEIKLNSASTVADASKCKVYMKNFGEFFNNQIEHAGTIILSRTQNISAEKLNKAIELIRQLNPNAHIITTPWDDIEGAQILGAMENVTNLELEMLAEAAEKAHQEHEHHHHHDGECCGHDHDHHHHDGECCGHDHEHEEHEHHHHDGECCGHDHDHEEHEHHHHDGECCGHDHDHEHEHHHHDGECGCGHHHHEGHHHADEVFTSWGTETPNKYDKATLDDILDTLANSDEFGKILRAKGMLPTQEGTWMYFDLVPGEYEIREGKPDFTGRICVIGAELKEEELKKLFNV